MITLGESTFYMDGVEIGEATSVSVQLSSKVLPKHFKSVKLNGEELIHNPIKEGGYES